MLADKKLILGNYSPAHSPILLGLRQSLQALRRSAPGREIIMLGLVLGILQILDGLMTGLGVSLFGTAAEGNPLLRCLMENCGIAPTLYTAKTMAILCVYLICRLSIKVSWAQNALRGLVCIYLLFAVSPWFKILLEHSFAQ